VELEKEIKQEQFRNVHQKMTINLFYTSSWLQSLVAQHLKPYDISPQQFNILRILRGHFPKPAQVNVLQDRMLDKMSNASRLVEKLRKKELIERKICKHDRRAVDVIITKKGLELLVLLDEVEDEWHQQLNTINDQEAEILNNLLDKLRN
jgi:DNA-binding MarR family transcriptional regulator